ncbi:AAA family ATPase [Patescibacteria group bacterium]|nr:AAA family ATPase [Patescibacteria group bacterium]MCL5010497.1 AAA family ATPase [Patescibacteria group bacterium]
MKNGKANQTNHKINHRKKAVKLRFDFSWKNILLYSFLGFFLLFILIGMNQPFQEIKTVPISTVVKDVQNGQVKEISVSDTKLTVTLKTGAKVQSFKEAGSNIYQILKDAGISKQNLNKTSILIKDNSGLNNWINILSSILPVILMVAFFYFLFRQARGAQESIFSFGQSKAKLFGKDMPRVTFADVAGVDEAKQELTEIVDFLKHPQKYRAMGARTPKGVLMVGPSGTGKTLLARSVAGEAGVPFFSMAGSEFMEMLVGVGASVTGDTPILIQENGKTNLLPIGEFVDKFYKNETHEGIVSINNFYTLGFDKEERSGFYGYRNGKMQTIKNSSFKKISSIFRHRVNEIYEIHYLGGVIKATADHSIFIRRSGRILSIATRDLKKGDLLVELPLNIRLPYLKGERQRHKIISHKFTGASVNLVLDVWNDDSIEIEKYKFATSQKGLMSQYAIASQIGVSQATVGHWQNNIYSPQKLSKKLVKLHLPDKVLLAPTLMRLFGYYTAEGRGTNSLEFTFGAHEKYLHQDVISSMREIFGIEPVLRETQDNSLKIIYYSAHLGRFFARHCGNGSHNKHIPEFLWDLPQEYFFEFLRGYWEGDGYRTKSGKLSMTSCSKQLILELSWLCSMHGIKVGIKHSRQKAGRVIKNRNKPLPGGDYWSLIIGKTSDPFLDKDIKSSNQFKRAIVKKIVKKPYKGFVYDLCGVENEAFFGGEKPVLLHNSRVRDLFNTAKKSQPAIIFIDEIDAIGRQRGVGLMGGHDEREQTLNQILVEMDGFSPTEQLVVVAATNRPDVLDPALIRPGRFDRRVVLDLPDVEGRRAILAIHAKGKPFEETVDWEKAAKRTVGFSGADLENMLNEAAILAARFNKKAIDMKDLEEAATKVKLGPEKRRLQSDQDRKMTAYHEAGHALVSWQMPHMDPIHRISIVSRGLSLGHTMMEPTERVHETKTHLLEQVAVMLGGRAAESLVFNEMTTGASDDIARATEVARTMVVEYGMSDLGPINLDGERRPFYEQATLSPDMASKVDSQVKRITDEAYKIAASVLQKLTKKLDLLAGELLKKETIEAEEFERLIGPKITTSNSKLVLATIKA